MLYALLDLLKEIKEKQEQLGINTKYVICHKDGSPINKESYETAIRRLCGSLEYDITNNHAFRMSLNSLVLIPAGFTVAERSAMLGHSVAVNQRNYTFDERDSIKTKKDKFDDYYDNIEI